MIVLENLASASNIMKVVRGVYIEFSEIPINEILISPGRSNFTNIFD